MAFKAPKSGGSFDQDRLPSRGRHQGCIAEVLDMGEMDDRFNPGEKKHKGVIVVEVPEIYSNPDHPEWGENCKTIWWWFNVSSWPKSNIGALWRDIFGEDIYDNADYEELVGRPIEVVIEESKTGARFIKSIGKDMSGNDPHERSPNYKTHAERQADKARQKARKAAANGDYNPIVPDDEQDGGYFGGEELPI